MLRDTLIYLSGSGTARRFVTHAPGARSMARRFVAGETIEDGINATRALNKAGMAVTLDYLGESVSSMISRSMPMPQPPAGGMPYSSART